MEAEEMIEKIIDYVDEKIDDFKVDRKSLVDSGGIFYMNGNDGTMFDYEENDRLCEFEVFYSSTNYCFLKMFIGSNGEFLVYIYDEIEKNKYTEFRSFELNEEEVEELAYFMYDNFDKHRKWDQNIEEVLG